MVVVIFYFVDLSINRSRTNELLVTSKSKGLLSAGLCVVRLDRWTS